MQLQEGLSEAGGEGRSGLGDSALGSGKLCGESGQEVVLGLFGSQDGYRRQYAEGVSGQEDNFLGCRRCGYRAHNVLNMVNRIRYTGVLGHALIGEVDLAVLIQSYVLKQSVSLDCVVDIRLGVLVQVDNLCIAAALEVEHAVVVPAVLVIADQQTLGIGGKGGLTGSGKAEEDGGVLTVHIGIRGAVHGSDSLQRQVVVHHGEHTLLHLSAIPGVQDNLLAAGDVEYNCRLGVQSQLLVVLNLRLGSVVDNEIRLKVCKLFLGRLNEHVGYKVCLPGNFHDETDRHAGILSIYNIQLLIRELLQSNVLYCLPGLFGSGMVVVLILIGGPPHGVLGILVHNDEFVFGGTSRIDTGHYVNCSQFADLSFLVSLKTGLGLFFK